MARRLAFVSSTIQFHVVRSCHSVYFVFSVAVCGTTDQSEEHLDVHRSSLRRVSLAARLSVFVLSLIFLLALCTRWSEVLGQMHTNVKTTDVCVGRLVCRVGARRPRCTDKWRHREEARQARWSGSVEINCHNTLLDQSIRLYLKRCSRVLFDSHSCRLLMPCDGVAAACDSKRMMEKYRHLLQLHG